ncbi:uncharacterized protein LOC141852498 [Brevipalpus obovatus]|uniref:uncharacterized protein LOC141852498 n=1 Tax=Brevipalpus obovatus TaxID=246614 RepID=UPI003D9F1A82
MAEFVEIQSSSSNDDASSGLSGGDGSGEVIVCHQPAVPMMVCELEMFTREELDTLCNDDPMGWLISSPSANNNGGGGDDGDDLDHDDVNEWLYSVLDKASTNRVRPELARLTQESRETRLDTRTITKKRPTLFNRFSSTEELSMLRLPSSGNLYNNKLNLSSHNIAGSNGNLSQLHTNTINSTIAATMDSNINGNFMSSRKSRYNNTFSMDDNERVMETPLRREPPRIHMINGNTITRKPDMEPNNQTSQQASQLKKKPLSMYAVYAKPTDRLPVRSSNSSMLSAYRKFKNSALNRQFASDYRGDDILINTSRFSPDFMDANETSTPRHNGSMSASRLIKRNGTFTCDKSLPRCNGSFIPKPK